MVEEEGRKLNNHRAGIKSNNPFNDYARWKEKFRENCYKRVREDRARLVWRLRRTESKDQRVDDKDFIQSNLKDIVSDELRKIKDSSRSDSENLNHALTTDDMIWEYEGLHTAYQGDCEEMLLEMQRIFYEDLRTEELGKEPESFFRTWEDEEDEYLARAVYEHMQLNDEQVHEKVWCPICKQGELKENSKLICCSVCELKLNKSDEVSLELLRNRLAEAHSEHLDRGCRLKPQFCIETRFQLTALYITCKACSTFDIVI